MAFDDAMGPDPWGNAMGYLANGQDYLLWSIGSDRRLDEEWAFGLNDSETGRIDTVLASTCAMQWWEGSQSPNVLGCIRDGDEATQVGRILEARMRANSS